MYYIEQVAAHTKLTEGQIEQWVEARNRAQAEEMDRSKFWYICYEVCVCGMIYRLVFLTGPPLKNDKEWKKLKY